MSKLFEQISQSWVLRHPTPVGVIEFIGGAAFGSVPCFSYTSLLHSLYEAGYTVIAVPFKFGFDHKSRAEKLLIEQKLLRSKLEYSQDLPHIWVGHSLGCKYIMLLEAYGKIMNQPSLLIAPDIGDTKDALPISSPGLIKFLDKHNIGVRPNKQETKDLVQQSALFNLTALISFNQDGIAGNQSGIPEASDVFWFIQTLAGKNGRTLLRQEIPGGHNEIVGLRVGNFVIDFNLAHGLLSPYPKQSELLVIEMLEQLRKQAIELGAAAVEPGK